MVWTTTDIVPTQLNLAPNLSENLNAIVASVTVKLVPRTSTNAVFDCTACTGATLKLTNNPALPVAAQLFGSITPTLVAHDATGVTLLFAASDFFSELAVIGTMSPKGLVTFTDGVTTLTCAVGAVNYGIVA